MIDSIEFDTFFNKSTYEALRPNITSFCQTNVLEGNLIMHCILVHLYRSFFFSFFLSCRFVLSLLNECRHLDLFYGLIYLCIYFPISENRGRYPSSYQEKLANAKRHRLQQNKSNETHLSESDDTCNDASLTPPRLANAHVRSKYYYDSDKKTYVMFATYSCEEGYKLKYPDMRHLYCKNKKWVGPIMPECIQCKIFRVVLIY